MCKQECQQKTTSSEFVKWIRYLDDEVNAFHREDSFLAQIAAEIRRGNVKNPRRVKIKDFMLEFKMTKKRNQAEKKEQSDPEARMARSKSFWGAIAGVSKEK